MGSSANSTQQTIASKARLDRRIDVLATLQLLLESTGNAAFVIPLPKKLIVEIVDVLSAKAEISA